MRIKQEIIEWRSTSFSILLSTPKYALDIYNALNGSSYDNPECVEIIKVESGISLNVRNDATFVLFSELNLYEHQSTPNPNMPLRFLIYVGNIYKQLSREKNIYKSSLISIPAPNFVVFYNGNREDYYPDCSIQKLSDAYITKSDKVSLELECTVLNINKNHNTELKEISEAIRGYSSYTQKVKDSIAIGIDIEAAVRKAVRECIEEGILSEFFKENGEMIVSTDVWDCTFEKQIEMTKRDYMEEGLTKGRAEGLAEGRAEGLAEGRAEAERTIKLINLLITDERFDDVKKVAENSGFREELFVEYNI